MCGIHEWRVYTHPRGIAGAQRQVCGGTNYAAQGEVHSVSHDQVTYPIAVAESSCQARGC